MASELSYSLGVRAPRVTKTFDQIMVEILRDAVEEATRNLRASAPQRTGALRGGFHSAPISDGGVLRNQVTYSRFVREAGGLPPMGVLVAKGVREIADRMLDERADEIAASMLSHAIDPLREVADD